MLQRCPAEVYSGAPLQAAMTHFPITLRQMLRADAPLEWTGGQVAIVPKPGKPATSVEGWRSILLLDPAHKAVARAVRPTLLTALDKVAYGAQCGGRCGMPLELPTPKNLCPRAFGKVARQQNLWLSSLLGRKKRVLRCGQESPTRPRRF